MHKPKDADTGHSDDPESQQREPATGQERSTETASVQADVWSECNMRFYGCLVVVTLLATVLRFWGLADPSTIIDEIASVRDAVRLVQDPVDTAVHMVKFLGYVPVAIGLWANGVDLASLDPYAPHHWQAAGVTIEAIRFFPALLGSVTPALLGLASHRWLGRPTAVVLALLLAVSPWHLYWSQWGRFYILQFLLYSLAFAWYFTGTRNNSVRHLLAAMAAFVLAVLSQLTSAIFVFIVGADWLIARLTGRPLVAERYVRFFLVGALLLGGAIVVSQILIIPDQWADHMSFDGFAPITLTLKTVYFVGPAVIIAAIAAVAMYRRETGMFWYLIAGAVLPIIVFAILSFRDYSGSRYAFMCLLPWLALCAISVTDVGRAVKPHLGRTGACLPASFVLVAMALVIFQYYGNGHGFRPNWTNALSYVETHRKVGERVYVDHPPVGQYYLQEAAISPAWQVSRLEAPRQVWIVTIEDPSDSPVPSPPTRSAVLKATYVSHAIVPSHRVNVFYISK